MTFEDAIAYSRNVVAAKVALGLGPATRDGVGDPPRRRGRGSASAARPASTSPARSRGIVRDPAIKPWRQIDLANGAFGQGVAVTPLQLATAYAAMINGGTLVQPHVVKAIGDRTRGRRRRRGQVIDPALSTTLIGMMNHVVTTVPFYRDRTLIPGYDVGGKTGTAQIWDPKANDGQAPGSTTSSTTRSSATSAAQTGDPGPRRRGPDRGGDARPSPGSASSRCR